MTIFLQSVTRAHANDNLFTIFTLTLKHPWTRFSLLKIERDDSTYLEELGALPLGKVLSRLFFPTCHYDSNHFAVKMVPSPKEISLAEHASSRLRAARA